MASGLLHALQIGGDSVEVTTGGAGEIAIPALDTGEQPAFVYCACEGGVGDGIGLRPGLTGQAITPATGLAISSLGDSAVVLAVKGQTHIAHVAVSGTPVLHITPLTNQ